MPTERQWSFSDSMEQAIQAAGSEVELMRDLGVGRFTNVRDEFTTWIDEQRSWEESCGFADQSYHMTDHYVEGPDALEFYSRYGINNFDNSEPGKAKQLVVANPSGYYIGDVILFHLDDNEFLSVGAAASHNWLQYHIETGEFDVTGEIQPRPVSTGEDPTYFRYQVQGPKAYDIMDSAIDGSLPELGFFNFTDASIDGREINLLRHGMAGQPGFEFWGTYDDGEDVKAAVLEAGEAHGIKRLGSVSYQTANAILGWIPLVIPAIFDDELQAYREWLSVGDGLLSIGGSFESNDITDYYFTPFELGYGRVIDFDHDFVGKEALKEEENDRQRQKVTLVWNSEDVLDVFASLFESGDTNKYIDLPHPRSSACHYDEVRAEGDLVGFSTDKSYVYNQREMLSLGVVQTAYAEPGTEVTITWGEPPGTENPKVEEHVQTEIRATVAPVPYIEDQR